MQFIEDDVPVVKYNGLNTATAVDFTNSPSVALPASTTINGSTPVVSITPITSTSANAFAVGPAGNTNPTFNVDSSTATSVTGVSVKSAASGGGVTITATSSATNENVELNAKGSGSVLIGSVATPITVTTGGSLTLPNAVQAGISTAITAGGSLTGSLKMSSATNFGIFVGSGLPTISAAQGSLYLRSDGSSTSTRLYVNTTGSTVWTNVTTAA